MAVFKVGYVISGEDGVKEEAGGELSLGVASDGSTKWQAWGTVATGTLKALGSEATLVGFADLAPGDQATVRAALADAAGSGGGAPPPAAPAEEAPKAEPEPAAPAAAEPAPEAPPAPAPVVPAPAPVMPAPAPAPLPVAPVAMPAPVPAPVPVVPAPVPVAAPPMPMPVVPPPAPVPVAPQPMAHAPQLQPQAPPPQPMAPGAALGNIPMAYQMMMGGGGGMAAYQQMAMQQQMQQALAMQHQAQLKRPAPPVQGLPGQYGVGAPVQKKRRSKRDESDEDDAPLTDSDDEGGQWRQPLGRMEPEQPVRRSSRRAAAEGVKRLTQALHGPSEYDEDE